MAADDDGRVAASHRAVVVVVVVVVVCNHCVVVMVVSCRMVVVCRCVMLSSSILTSRLPSLCVFASYPLQRRCVVTPPPKVAEGKGRVTVVIPSAHSEGEGNTAMVTCASPLEDVMARPEGTVDMPRSHRDVALS
jgi:hypothetical protein